MSDFIVRNNLIFLSVPIQGVRNNAKLYDQLYREIRKRGMVLSNPCVFRVPTENECLRIDAQMVWSTMIEKLEKSSAVIADISYPSLGVGYEISEALKMNKPVICLYEKKMESKTSLMILGIRHKLIEFACYSSENAVPKILDKFFFKIKANSELNYGKKVEHHFDSLSNNYDSSTPWRGDVKLLKFFSERLEKANTVLEIGSGTGVLSKNIENGKKKILIGADISEKMLKLSMSHFDLCARTNIECLPFKSECFDAVIVRQVFHYLDMIESVKEIKRVLKNGGEVLSAHIVATDIETLSWWDEVKKVVQPLRKLFFLNLDFEDIFFDFGFRIKSHDVILFKRFDEWEKFFVNTETREDVDRFFNILKHTSPRVVELLGIEYNDIGISYSQKWSLIEAVKE